MVRQNKSNREGALRDGDGSRPALGDTETPHPHPGIIDMMQSYRGWWNLPKGKRDWSPRPRQSPSRDRSSSPS